MKAVLLNPPGPYCRAGSRWPHRSGPRGIGIDYNPFPFALGYAAGRLRADGHEAVVVDCIAERMPLEDLQAKLADLRPDAVVMETSAPSFDDDVATLRVIDAPCYAAGTHATATPAEHLAAGFAGVIRGEYDQVVTRALTGGPQPWLATAGQPEAELAPLTWELDEIPWAPYEDMPMHRYGDSFCLGFAVTVLTSRGCPLACSFCNLPGYQGGKYYRRRSAKGICDEIAFLVERFKPDEIYFDDDTISANRNHVLELCAELEGRGFGLPFSCMANAAIPSDVLEAMRRAGCRAIKFGVESANAEVQAAIPKPLDLDEVRATVRHCREVGIRTHATYLFGLPGETPERAQETIDFALKLGTNTLQFAIATPYPGTRLYEEAKEKGWLAVEGWQHFDGAQEAVLSYPGYSAADIAAMHRRAWKAWHWHLLTRQPSTLLHHWGNAVKREGLPGLLRIARYSAGRFASILKPGG